MLRLLPFRLGIPASGFVYAFIGPAHVIYHRIAVPRLMPAVWPNPGDVR